MRTILMASTSLLMLVTGSAAVLAQTTGLNNGESTTVSSATLSTVTVTADKRKVNLQKSAVDATVLKGEELKSQGLGRVDDIMRGVIGVSTQETQVGPTFFMRGVGDTGQTASPVAVYVDGVYQDRSEATRGGTLDLDQIEISRGPQGTSLGANSMAGAVSLQSNEPSFTRSASIAVTRGNLNRLTVEAVVNQPITDDQAIRIAASTDSQDGYYTSGLENTDNKEARVKYRWRPSGDLDIVGTVDDQLVYGNNGSGNNAVDTNAAGVATNNNDEWKMRGNPWNDGEPYGYYNTFHHTQITSAHVNVDDNLNWATLTLTPNWEQTNYHSLEAARSFMGSSSSNYQDDWETTESFDAKLASPTSQRFQWVAGLYYYHSSQTGPGGQYVLAGGDAQNCGGAQGTGTTCETTQNTKVAEISQEAAYLNTTYSIFSGLRLLTGLRFNNEDISSQTSGTIYSPEYAPVGFTSDQYSPLFKRRVNRPDYKISLEYDVTPTSMAYYTFSTGTNLGGIPNAGPPVGGGAAPAEIGTSGYYYLPASTTVTWVQPQELYSHAIGYKSRFFDNSLQFNAELYYQWYNNYSVQLQNVPETATAVCTSSSPLPPGQSLPGCYAGSANTTNLVEKGGDVTITYLPGPNDRITFNAGYLDASWGAQTPNTPYALVNAYLKGYSGAVLQNSPKWQMNATYAHTFDLGDAGTITPSANVQAKTSYYSTFMGGSSINPSGAIQNSYAEFNLYTNYTTLDGKYSVYGYVNNLTNKAIITNYTSGFGATSIDLAPPREYGVTVSAKF